MDHEHDTDPEPISIARCRAILGDEAIGLSDPEIEEIRRHAEVMARVIVEIFRECGSHRGRE